MRVEFHVNKPFPPGQVPPEKPKVGNVIANSALKKIGKGG